MTVAARGAPVSRASSPKKSPGPYVRASCSHDITSIDAVLEQHCRGARARRRTDQECARQGTTLQGSHVARPPTLHAALARWGLHRQTLCSHSIRQVHIPDIYGMTHGFRRSCSHLQHLRGIKRGGHGAPLHQNAKRGRFISLPILTVSEWMPACFCQQI